MRRRQRARDPARLLVRRILGVLILAGAGLWWLLLPRPLPEGATDGLAGDPARGETVFRAAGCAACHAEPGAPDSPSPVLAGGLRLATPFGTFVAPNISPSPQGIGGWSTQDLADALLAGVSPDGRHYYPALPYASYARMRLRDVADLKAFLDTLPPSPRPSEPHALRFPFSVRLGIGAWKRLHLDTEWVLDTGGDPVLERGRYLVEALGHCAECHTPRGPTGGLDRSRWMQGAPNPAGRGRIPALTPDRLDWSAADIAYYLETGFTPDYDSAGGEMARVITNMAYLPAADRAAIAAYLKALPRPTGAGNGG